MIGRVDMSRPVSQGTFAAMVGVSQFTVSGLVAAGVLKRGASARAWLLAYTSRLRSDEFNRRLALQDAFEGKSIASFQEWYAKRRKDEQNAGLGAQEAVRNYLDEISKTATQSSKPWAIAALARGRADEPPHGQGLRRQEAGRPDHCGVLRLQVIRPIMQQALGG